VINQDTPSTTLDHFSNLKREHAQRKLQALVEGAGIARDRLATT
jgi:hypothetical protein